MEGKRREVEDMQESLVVEEGMIDPFCHFCSSCFKVFSTKRKLDNHIVEIQKEPTS